MQYTTQSHGSYRVLSHEEPEEIMIELRNKKSIRAIARTLNRHPSVISREIKTYSTEDGRYQVFRAQNRSARRRKNSRRRERIGDRSTRSYIREKLTSGWSPEQIAGRMGLDELGKTISHETIYQYIFKTERSLTKFLVCGRKKR